MNELSLYEQRSVATAVRLSNDEACVCVYNMTSYVYVCL